MSFTLAVGPLPGNELVQVLPVEGTITSEFGLRKHPITRRHHWHEGIDIANARGTEVGSTAHGRVVQVGRERGYGLIIEIDHGSGWTSCYAHLSHATVSVGDVVGAGTVIGKMGRSGTATGVHLHYELRHYGMAVNPHPFFQAVSPMYLYASVTF